MASGTVGWGACGRRFHCSEIGSLQFSLPNIEAMHYLHYRCFIFIETDHSDRHADPVSHFVTAHTDRHMGLVTDVKEYRLTLRYTVGYAVPPAVKCLVNYS